jgi:hypothetical protein
MHREIDSNEITQSKFQDEKHDDRRIAVFGAISIDSSDEGESADNSIRMNRGFDSNEIAESD